MRFTLQPPLLSLLTCRRVLITALIYSLAIIPTKLLLMLLPGAEVRFGACIPVVMGMLWGPAGAVGSALGNFLGDFYAGDSLYVCFWGAIANFFLSYLPYKLWYGLKADAKTCFFIHDTRSFLKFLGIIFVTSFIFASMLTAIVRAMGNTSSIKSFFIFFSNNFDFPLLLGIPLLFLLRGSRLTFVLPPVQKKSARPYLLVLLAAAVGCLIFLAAAVAGSPGQQFDDTLFLAVITLLLIYVSRLPANYDPQPFNNDPRFFYSIGAKATTGFLQLAILSVLFIGFSIFITNPALLQTSQQLDLWQTIFTALLLSINIIFIAVLFILWQTEKKIVRPLIRLSQNARKFAGCQYLTAPAPVPKKNDAAQTVDEIDDLNDSFTKMTADLRRYVSDLSTAIAERETLAAQLNIAAEIQQNMLADTAKINQQLKQYQLFAGMFPAKEVGGDLYDCFFLDDEHLVILIADVAGKGIPAALFMMVTKALLKNNASASPGKILEQTNNTLCENNDSMMFVTVWLGIVHLPSGRLTYANAGHNYPLLQISDQRPEQLCQRSGPALGVCCNLSFPDHTAELPYNSRLLLYTDGINEAENRRHEFFGTDRLARRFERTHIPEDILFAVLEFSEGAEQSDDITVLWLERQS